jgi:pimeloyl-ACP methyl ester carboxylesterase
MDYDNDFSDEYADTSFGKLHFRHHAGKTTQIIFLHGLGANTMVWKRLVHYFPDDMDIYLVDLLGHGQSDAPADVKYTVSNQYQALLEFTSLQNNGSAFFFGHSYGGWVAAFYAAQPTGCKGIILEDAAGLKEMFDKIKETGEEGIMRYKENMIRNAMMISGNREYVIRSVVDSDILEDQLDDALLSEIKVPSMVIWGSDDKMVDVSYGEKLAEKVRGSEMHVINGAGHDAHFTNAEEVAKLIIDFVGRNQQG